MKIKFKIQLEVYFMNYYGIFRDFPLHKKGESKLHIDEPSMFDSEGYTSYPRSDGASEIFTISTGVINLEPIERKNFDFGHSFI